jgi:chromosome segregation ATPase
MLTERIEELVQELAMLRAEHAALEQETPLPDTSELEARLAATREELSQQRGRLTSVEQEMHELQRDALANEQAAARARAVADDYTRRLSDAEGEIARIGQEEAASAGGRKQIIGELAAWAQEYTRALADSVSAQGALEQARIARDRAAGNEAHAREEQRRLEDELRMLRNELEAAQIKLDLYETIEVQPHAPDAGVRLILEAGGIIKRETVPADIELSGVRGLIGQLIRVPNGLEKAIGRRWRTISSPSSSTATAICGRRSTYCSRGTVAVPRSMPSTASTNRGRCT